MAAVKDVYKRQEMNKAAKNSGKFLMIGQNQRLAKAHIKAKKIIERDELGKVISFQTKFCHPGPVSYTHLKL